MRDSRELDGILIRLYVMTHSIRHQHGIRADAVPMRPYIMTYATRHALSLHSPELVRRLTT